MADDALARFQEAASAEEVYCRHNTLSYTRAGSADPLGAFSRGPFMGDCGLDLAIAHDVTLRMGESANVPCGVRIALPVSTFGWIVGRSSTWLRHGLLVLPGIIDEGWRGELCTLLYKPYSFSKSASASAHETVNLTAGTRLAQLLVLPNLMRSLALEATDELPDGARGTSGFGSSGT